MLSEKPFANAYVATKDSLKNTVWNRRCFWRHKIPCIRHTW